jgi:hypothetical protein
MVVRVTGAASRGPAGPKGETGAKGDAGPQGAQGLQGAKGDQGPVGPTGAAGQAGQTGQQGPAGPQGQAGTPKRIERYTANTNASGIATFTFPTFTAAPDIDVIQTWVADQQVGGGVTAQTLTGCTVLCKVSRGTLLLTSGPFQTAAAGVPVTIRVMGN